MSFIIAFFILVAHADPGIVEVKLHFPSKAARVNLNEKLVDLKRLENSSSWQPCSQKARGLVSEEWALRKWILLTGLRCARRHLLEEPKSQELVTTLKQFKTELADASGELNREVLRGYDLLLSKSESLPAGLRWMAIDEMIGRSSELTSEQRSKVYLAASKLAQEDKQEEAGKQFLSQSGTEKTSSSVGEVALSAKELKWKNRIANSQAKKKSAAQLLPLYLGYLNDFPNGLLSKEMSNRALDAYANIRANKATAGWALDQLSTVEPYRAQEWAGLFYRRSDYETALRLADRGLSQYSNTALAGRLLYIAGGSAQLLGKFSQARKFMTRFIETQSGSEDLSEIKFRLGLVELRSKRYKQAIRAFDQVLGLPEYGGRYELSARYWLMRSLAALKNSRADQERAIILDKFPFSYFGLKLRAENPKDLDDWLQAMRTPLEISGSYYLLGNQHEDFQRAQRLAAHGWMREAYAEVSQLPMPKGTNEQVLWGSELARLQVFSKSMRLLSAAMDEDANLRKFALLRVVFPTSFDSLIDPIAKKNGLQSTLVKSLIRQESAFYPYAVSSSNAMGLMQLIPPTAQEVANDLGIKNKVLSEDAFDVNLNLEMGTRYIRRMIRRFEGNVPMGLAAYNAGPTRVSLFVQARPELGKMLTEETADVWQDLWMDELPWFETSFYVKAILRNVVLNLFLDEGPVDVNGVFWRKLVLSLPENGKSGTLAE